MGRIFLLLFCFACSQALYEDQINKFDWKKEYIGKITDVTYENSLSISKNLFVITEEDVVASLSSKNGQINWRHLMDENMVKVLQYQDGLLTVSSKGIIRVWDPESGLLKRDANLPYEAKEDAENFKFIDIAVLDLTYTEGNMIVVLSSNTLYTIRIQTSPKLKFKLKTASVEAEEGGVQKLYVNSQTKQIAVLKFKQAMYVSSKFYDAKTLEIANEHRIETPWLDNVEISAVLEGDRLVYISKEMEAIYIVDLVKGSEIGNEPLSTLGISSDITTLTGIETKDISAKGEDFFGISSGEVAHLRLSEENTLSVVKKHPCEKRQISVDAKQVGSEIYYFVITVDRRDFSIKAFDIKNGAEDTTLSMDYQLPPGHGEVEAQFINMYLKRSSPIGYRVLVTTTDDSVLMLTQPPRIAWSREESLASVVAAEMLDLPLSDIEAGIEVEFEEAEKQSVFGMFYSRISAQIGQLKSFAKHLTRGIKEGTLFEKKTKDPLIQVEGLTRDPFSLHKMLLLVTESGKIFGVDSLTGEIAWQLSATEMRGLKLRLFIQRTTSHYPNPPAAVLFGTDNKGTTRLLSFNPITGEVKGREVKNFGKVVQIVLLPFADTLYLRPLLIVDEQYGVHLVPDTTETRTKLARAEKSIFLYNVEQEAGELAGFSFNGGTKMQQTWSISIPSNQEIVAVQGKDPIEKVDSMGRPLADRSVIYKYLNPNLVAVVTASKETNKELSTVTLYLIDAVSGRMVHTAVQKKASGPVHIVHSENWLVYTYWNTKARRNEISSLELYGGKHFHNGTTFSSFDPLTEEPLVVQQSYILPSSIRALGVSRTEKGLTSRQLLFGLTRGAVLGLPRRLFDPRRPIYAQQSHREEGLMPYNPEIALIPSLMLNYNKTIHRITGIYSSPSALESTSIVLVTGLDIFFTRTQPSKMFDVLKDDFEHLFIVVVLSGMFIAAITTRKLAQNKKLNKAWR